MRAAGAERRQTRPEVQQRDGSDGSARRGLLGAMAMINSRAGVWKCPARLSPCRNTHDNVCIVDPCARPKPHACQMRMPYTSVRCRTVSPGPLQQRILLPRHGPLAPSAARGRKSWLQGGQTQPTQSTADGTDCGLVRVPCSCSQRLQARLRLLSPLCARGSQAGWQGASNPRCRACSYTDGASGV